MIWSYGDMALVEDETIPILAIYAIEYMLTRKTDLLVLISTLCMAGIIHQRALVNIFRTVVDKHGYVLESYHEHFDIHSHYVYLRCVSTVAVITLQDKPDESAVALISPVDEDEDTY